MDRRLKKLVFSFLIITEFIFIPVKSLHAQPVLLRDSIQQLLTYFYTNTDDENLKQDIAKAKDLYINELPDNTVAVKLIDIAVRIKHIADDHFCINEHPYDIYLILDYAQKLKEYTADLLPLKKSLLYAAALQNLGIQYISTAYIKTLGKNNFQAASEIRKKISGEKDPDYLTSIFYTIWATDADAISDKTPEQMRSAFELRKNIAGDSNRIYAEELAALSSVYNARREYAKAGTYLQMEILAWQKIYGNNALNYAMHLCNIALLHDEFSQYTKALKLYTEAKEITEKNIGKQNQQYIYCLNNIGEMYQRLGLYRDALDICKQVVALAKNLPYEKRGGLPLYLTDMATNYIRMGEYAKALPVLKDAIKIDREFRKGSSEGLAYFAYHLATAYISLGQYSEALTVIKSGLENCEKYYTGGRFSSRLLSNMANVYEQKHQYDSAIYCSKKATETAKKYLGKLHRDYLDDVNNLANLYIQTHYFNNANALLQELLATRKKILGFDHPDYAASLFSMGDLYRQKNNYDSSRFYYKQTLSIQKKALGEQHPDYIKTLNRLALVELITGNSQNAADDFIKANQLSAAYIRNNYTSLSEQEKLLLINENSLQFGYLPSMLTVQKYITPSILEQVYNNELVLKSMVLQDQQNVLHTIKKNGDTAALVLYEQWRNNRSLLGIQLLKPVKDRLPYMDSLQQLITEQEQELSLRSSAFNTEQQKQNITIKDIIQNLDRNEATLEFIRYPLYNKNNTRNTMYAAILLLHGDSLPKFIPLCKEKELQNLLITEKKSSLAVNLFYPDTNDTTELSRSLSKKLYTLVWKPIEKYLRETHTVYFVPAGLLNRVAFQALRSDAWQQLLIDKYSMVQLLSTRSIALPEKIKLPAGIDIWGNIQYDYLYNKIDNQISPGNDLWSANPLPEFNFYNLYTRESRGGKWKPLPGTKQEMDSINKICSASGLTVYTVYDSLATEETFKTLDGKAPEMLHIATHGFFLAANNDAKQSSGNAFAYQQNPMLRCGLALAGSNPAWAGENITDREDGILTAYEIAQMDLSNTDLVVLSACETALGDIQGNEGVIGLQRAFKLAGVKQIIMSLWKVPDAETTELMAMFYRNWLNGQSAREALRSAQLKMKTKYPPYDWAGFVLVE